MRFWIRELLGWVLIILGLFLFYIALGWLSRPQADRIISSGPVVLMGIFVFRGGIHMLKVAVAARVCLHARKIAEDKK